MRRRAAGVAVLPYRTRLANGPLPCCFPEPFAAASAGPPCPGRCAGTFGDLEPGASAPARPEARPEQGVAARTAAPHTQAAQGETPPRGEGEMNKRPPPSAPEVAPRPVARKKDDRRQPLGTLCSWSSDRRPPAAPGLR
jgi:hypothetical protein